MDFREAKQKKERGMSNVEFWESEKERIESADQVVVVLVKDGISSFGHTGGATLPMIGALEHAKFVLSYNSTNFEE